MTTVKEWLNANVWDGEDRSGCKTDSAVFNPDELLELVSDCVAATQQQWISVDELLPEVGDGGVSAYICFYNGKPWTGFYYKTRSEWWSSDSVDLIHQVTHWMPLPPAPEAE